MPFKTDEFLGALNKRGLSKTSHFEVKIHGPLSGDVERDLSFRVDTAEIPGRTLSTTEHRYYGPIRKIPYASTYTDTSMTFLCSKDLTEKVYMEEWQNLAQNHIPAWNRDSEAATAEHDHYNLGYYDEYVKTIVLCTYDELQNQTSEHTFQEAYPIGIAPIAMSWASDDYIKLGVTFAYRDYIFNNNFMPKPAPKPNVGLSGNINIGGINIGGNFDIGGISNLSVGGFKVPIPKVPNVGGLVGSLPISKILR